jgi:ribonuclease J
LVEVAGALSGNSKKPKVFNLGEHTKIEVWGGYGTIGGNRIVVRDRDEAIVLDQGLDFSAFKKYYGGFIQPGNDEDLREIGAIPPKTFYEGVSNVYISHFHLDHMGSLNVPFEYNVKVYIPSKMVFKELSSFWYMSWKELLLPKSSDLSDLINVTESPKNVKPILVSHSSYPSYSFLVETSEGDIVYTGDFRASSPINLVNTFENLQEVLGGEVDMLIVEGTNFTRRMTPLVGEDVMNIISRVVSKYDERYMFVSAHPLDIEAFLLVSNILRAKGFEPVLTHAKYAALLDACLRRIGIKDIEFLLLDLRGELSKPLQYVKEVELRDLKDRRIAFFTSITAVNEIKMLNRRGIDLRGLLQITLTGEPVEEEGRIMEARLGNWARKFGINTFRLHLSGHYLPYEFKEIIRVAKPKKLIPIHTKAPQAMLSIFNKYRG